MRPTTSILDESFAYVPARETAVQRTWRRFGWAPLTDAERRARIERALAAEADASEASATPGIGH